MKIIEEYMLPFHRQTPGNERFKGTEKLLLSNIAILDQFLPTVETLVSMARVVSQKALYEFILQKCKKQTMTFTKRFKLRGNSPQINKATPT